MAVTSFLGVVGSQADKAIVSKLMPVGIFGYYGIAYAGVSKGQLVTAALAQAALPSLCELHAAGNRNALLSQYNRLQDLLCFITLPIFAAIPFATLPIFTFVLNAQAARLLLLPITFLCLGFYLNGTLNAPYVFSLAVGRPDISARFNIYALFVVPPTAAFLVYFWGLKGAAFSWVVYNLFAYVYSIRRICAECLCLSPWQWYLHVLKFIALAGFVYGAAWAARTFYGAGSIPGLALSYAVATALFLAIAYLLIGNELRISFKRLVFALTRP
jgi:O-antigen/teichoic acid export membrane protein